SHITDIDDELWDLVKEGVTFKILNETGRLSIADKMVALTDLPSVKISTPPSDLSMPLITDAWGVVFIGE
ncbi:hypothetical protein A2U01_0092967, partial [Trifolium medium]|nr:hypothetical protein [Trifolium medium]